MGDAGQSGTPLWRKLGVKPGGALLTVAAPEGWAVPELPDEAEQRPLDGEAQGSSEEVLIAFFSKRERLAADLPGLCERIFPDAALWVAWPRRAAGHDSDLADGVIRELALAVGVVDVKVAAIGEDWSGLRLVWPRERRRKP